MNGVYGFWVAYGEDRSNGGFWDKEDKPLLGYFEGEYEEVLSHVSIMKRWKSWGKGGELRQIEITLIK